MTTAIPSSAAEVLGFGFRPAESAHHFLVHTSPRDADVTVSEHHEWRGDDLRPATLARIGANDGSLRVIIPRSRFEAVAEAVASEFNRRLKTLGFRSHRFVHGLTPLARPLGKELVVLLWAIEDADPGQIPTALANWTGLHPEERWWLYTQANAATGDALTGRGRGWRKALRYALCENPADVPRAPVQETMFGSTESVWTPPAKRGRGRPRKETAGPSLFDQV